MEGDLSGLLAVPAPGSAPGWLEAARSPRALGRAELARLAARWRDAVTPGLRVGLLAPDPVDLAALLVCLVGAGAVVVPLDPSAPEHARRELLHRAGAKLTLAASGGTTGSFLRVGPGLTPPAGLPGGGGKGGGGKGGGGTTAGAGGPGGVLLFSSGSTGPRKAVMLEERQLLHVARAVAAAHRLTPADRGFNPLPLFHVNAEVVGRPRLPGLGRGAGARRPLPPDGLRGPRRRAPGHMDQCRAGDPVDPRRGAGERPLAPGRAVRPVGVRAAARAGARTLRAALAGARRRDLRHDGGGQPDHGEPAGRATAGVGRAAGGRRAAGAGRRRVRIRGRRRDPTRTRTARAPSASTPTAGSTPATSAASTTTATCTSSAAAATRSTAAARRSSRGRSRRWCAGTPVSATPSSCPLRTRCSARCRSRSSSR